MNIKRFRVVAALVGVLSLLLALCVWNQYPGGYEMSETYGGDAYTGIQNAAARTANNAAEVGRICRVGFCSVLAVYGATMLGVAFCMDGSSKRVPIAPASNPESFCDDRD